MQPKDLHGGLAFFFEQDHRDCEARWVDVEELLDANDIEMARAAWRKYEASMYRHLAMEEPLHRPTSRNEWGNRKWVVVCTSVRERGRQRYEKRRAPPIGGGLEVAILKLEAFPPPHQPAGSVFSHT